MTLDQIAALIGAVGTVLAMLHYLTAMDLITKLELAGVFAAAAGPALASSHNYVLAATAGAGAVGVFMHQVYKAPPGTVAVQKTVHPIPEKKPDVVKAWDPFSGR